MEYDIFISYSRKDSEIVQSVVDRLKVEGYSCWMDVSGIESGDAFKRVLVQAIKDSRMVLFFSSVNSNSTEWTVKEINIAVRSKKPIIPVLLDDTPYDDSILFDLSGLDYIPCHGGVGEKGYKKLLKSIVSKCGDVKVNGVANNLCCNKLFLDPKELSPNLDGKTAHIKEWYKRWRFVFLLVSCITVLITIMMASIRVCYLHKERTVVANEEDSLVLKDVVDDKEAINNRIHKIILRLAIRYDDKELRARLEGELRELFEIESDWNTIDSFSDEKKLVELRKERDVLQAQVAVMATKSEVKTIGLGLEGEIKEQVPEFRLYDKEEGK